MKKIKNIHIFKYELNEFVDKFAIINNKLIDRTNI